MFIAFGVMFLGSNRVGLEGYEFVKKTNLLKVLIEHNFLGR